MTENRRIQCTDNGDTITFYDLNKPNQTVEFSKESQPYKLIEPLIKKDSNTNDLYIEENKNNQIIITKNGIYIGEINKNGKKHGKGTYYYLNGDRYEGQWENGQKHGKGTYYYSNGDRYEVNLENGKKHGKGTYYYLNGDRYEGQWENGQKHGKETYYYSNGDRYEVNWENGKKHGKGTYHSNGDRHEVNWENGKMHMQTTFYGKFTEQDRIIENETFIELSGYTTTNKVEGYDFGSRPIKNGKIKLYDLKTNKDGTKTITYYTQTGQSISININENGFIAGIEPNDISIVTSAFENLDNLFQHIPIKNQQGFDSILAEIYMALNVTIMQQQQSLPIQIIDVVTNPAFEFENKQEVNKTEQLIELAHKHNPNGITIMPAKHLIENHQAYMIVYPKSMGKKIDIINTGKELDENTYEQLKNSGIEVREFYLLNQTVGNCVLASTLVTEKLLNSIDRKIDNFPQSIYEVISLLPIRIFLTDEENIYLKQRMINMRQSTEKLEKEQQRLKNAKQIIDSCLTLRRENFALGEQVNSLGKSVPRTCSEDLTECIKEISKEIYKHKHQQLQQCHNNK